MGGRRDGEILKVDDVGAQLARNPAPGVLLPPAPAALNGERLDPGQLGPHLCGIRTYQAPTSDFSKVDYRGVSGIVTL